MKLPILLGALPLSDKPKNSKATSVHLGLFIDSLKIGWLDSGELPSSYAIQVVCPRTSAIRLRFSGSYSGCC
tara:strand:- start:2278 stop:2493 length:216 start_codon:yes stop_codon:yes gene_type:complete